MPCVPHGEVCCCSGGGGGGGSSQRNIGLNPSPRCWRPTNPAATRAARAAVGIEERSLPLKRLNHNGNWSYFIGVVPGVIRLHIGGAASALRVPGWPWTIFFTYFVRTVAALHCTASSLAGKCMCRVFLMSMAIIMAAVSAMLGSNK